MRSNPALALIVEDDPEWMEVLTSYAVLCGFKVVQARSLAIALQEATNHYDLLISDLRLGGHADGGLEILGRARQTSQETVLMLVTSYGDASVRERVAALGGQYVPKENVTRGYFCTLLRRLCQLPADTSEGSPGSGIVRRTVAQFLVELASASDQGVPVVG